jgi:DNA polymerase III subunit delta
MTHTEILSSLKRRSFRPVYFLTGDEPYFIDLISDYIEQNVLTDDEKSFNQTVVYGRDVDMPTIVTMAKRYPMMAEYQVIIVKEAQDADAFEKLALYLDKPLQSTILVLCFKYKKIDKRTSENKRVVKLIEEKGVWFESKKLYDNQVPAWINSYLSEKNLVIDAKAATMMVDSLGTELSKIVNEVDKLIITLPQGHNRITAAHVEKMIGISKDFNTFELIDALSVRNVYKSFQIVDYFARNPKSGLMVMHLSTLFNYFVNVLAVQFMPKNPRGFNEFEISKHLGITTFQAGKLIPTATNYSAFKVVEIIALLRTYDAKSKGFGQTGTEDGELFKELVYKILN